MKQGMTRTAPDPLDSFDVRRRFVRIVEERVGDMIEFEFAIGEPELFVEMVMPRRQFDEFCRSQGVVPTHGRLPEQADDFAHGLGWTLAGARERLGGQAG